VAQSTRGSFRLLQFRRVQQAPTLAAAVPQEVNIAPAVTALTRLAAGRPAAFMVIGRLIFDLLEELEPDQTLRSQHIAAWPAWPAERRS
jgi:hypothetical protein